MTIHLQTTLTRDNTPYALLDTSNIYIIFLVLALNHRRRIKRKLQKNTHKKLAQKMSVKELELKIYDMKTAFKQYSPSTDSRFKEIYVDFFVRNFMSQVALSPDIEETTGVSPTRPV